MHLLIGRVETVIERACCFLCFWQLFGLLIVLLFLSHYDSGVTVLGTMASFPAPLWSSSRLIKFIFFLCSYAQHCLFSSFWRSSAAWLLWVACPMWGPKEKKHRSGIWVSSPSTWWWWYCWRGREPWRRKKWFFLEERIIMRSVWIGLVSLIDKDGITQRVPVEQKRRLSRNGTGHQPLWETRGERIQCRRLEGSVTGREWPQCGDGVEDSLRQGGMAVEREVTEKSTEQLKAEKRSTVLETRTQGCSKRSFSVMEWWGEGVQVPR